MNQEIKCNVYECINCDGEINKCNLKYVEVCNCRPQPDNKEMTMCNSFLSK